MFADLADTPIALALLVVVVLVVVAFVVLVFRALWRAGSRPHASGTGRSRTSSAERDQDHSQR